MKIWVDADGCPNAIKEILFRAANRTMITTTLVANQTLPIPPSRYIKMLRVNSGYDVADNEIVKQLSAGDLVITGDIPLANDVIEKGGHAITLAHIRNSANAAFDIAGVELHQTGGVYAALGVVKLVQAGV